MVRSRSEARAGARRRRAREARMTTAAAETGDRAAARRVADTGARAAGVTQRQRWRRPGARKTAAIAAALGVVLAAALVLVAAVAQAGGEDAPAAAMRGAVAAGQQGQLRADGAGAGDGAGGVHYAPPMSMGGPGATASDGAVTGSGAGAKNVTPVHPNITSIPWQPLQNASTIPWGGLINGSDTPFTPGPPFLPARSVLQQNLLRTSGGLSLMGASFILASYCLFPESRKFSRKILVYLSIADLFSSLAFVWSSTITSELTDPSAECIIQGFALQFFYLSSYMWTACFAFHLYQLIWKKNPSSENYERYYHIVSWGIPAALDAYFLVKFAMGETSMGYVDRPWCWINNTNSNTSWSWAGSLEQFVFFYAPVMILLMYNVMVYVFLAKVVGQVLSASMESKIRKRLLLYLLVFILCAAWGFANRIYQVFSHGHRPSFILNCLECSFSPLQGFLNALVYGLNEKLRDRYLTCCGGSSSASAGKRSRAGSPGGGLLPPSSPSTDREVGGYKRSTRARSFASVGSRASEPNSVAM